MQAWKYRIECDATEEDLNALGIEGWELVSVSIIKGILGLNDHNYKYYYFKRPN